VISGYVVTSSLLARQPVGPLAFLGAFYGRRFKRLLPALIGMVLLVSVPFSMLVSGAEDLFQPSLRTGLAALFGVSNLYLLKQGAGYFAVDTSFQPFLHTWSLGVEEQFYLVWPLIVLARWSVGINQLTVVPILALIIVFSLLSYRLELYFRYHFNPSAWPFKPWLVFPFFSLVAAAVVGGLQGPLRGWLFSGQKGDGVTVVSNNKKIPGTTISTADCFLEPQAPIAQLSAAKRCLAMTDPRQPTLFLKGIATTTP
jgi:peptidoglycan/LPS O-acetylase OafA/YrhL